MLKIGSINWKTQMLVVVTAGFGGVGFLSPRPNITSLTAEAMPISFCLAPKPS